jgi:hypothetical protein
VDEETEEEGADDRKETDEQKERATDSTKESTRETEGSLEEDSAEAIDAIEEAEGEVDGGSFKKCVRQCKALVDQAKGCVGEKPERATWYIPCSTTIQSTARASHSTIQAPAWCDSGHGLLLHCCSTVVTLFFTLLLHGCYTVVTLLLHRLLRGAIRSMDLCINLHEAVEGPDR